MDLTLSRQTLDAAKPFSNAVKSKKFESSDIAQSVIHIAHKTISTTLTVVFSCGCSSSRRYYLKSCDGVASELEVINSMLKQSSPFKFPLTVTTSSGLVAGILSGTRTCPRRYRALKIEFQKLILGRSVQVILETQNAVENALQFVLKHHSVPTTLQLLTTAYCAKCPNSRGS